MPNDTAELPSLDELVATGTQNNIPPERIAQGVMQWRDDARQNLKDYTTDSEQFFNAASNLDRDVQGKLAGLQQQTDKPIPQFTQPAKIGVPLMGPGNQELGVYQMQKGIGNDLDVLVNIRHPDNGEIDHNILRVPMVNQKDLDTEIADLTKKRDGYLATADEFANNEDAYGFKAQKMAEERAAKAELRLQQLQGPDGKILLQQDRIADAFKNSPLAARAGQWGIGEDLLRGFRTTSESLRYAIGSTIDPKDEPIFRQMLEGQTALNPGTTRPTGTAQFFRGAAESTPMMALSAIPGGQVIMGVSSYGNTTAEAMGMAEQADKQADALRAKNPELADKFKDAAGRMRDDARLYGGLTGATWALTGRLLPEAKTFAGGTARAGAETAFSQAVAGNVIKPAFTGEEDNPLNILTAGVIGAAAHAVLGAGKGIVNRVRGTESTPPPVEPTSQDTTTGDPTQTDTTQGRQKPPPGRNDYEFDQDYRRAQQEDNSARQQDSQRQQTQDAYGQEETQPPPPPPQPKGPPARTFNTQTEFNAFMDQASKNGDVEQAAQGFAMNPDSWRKAWVRAHKSASEQNAEFINSIFTGRSNAEHASYAQAQADARQNGAGAASGGGTGGGSGPQGVPPEARSAPETAPDVGNAPETAQDASAPQPVPSAEQPPAPQASPQSSQTPPVSAPAPESVPPSPLSEVRNRGIEQQSTPQTSLRAEATRQSIPSVEQAFRMAQQMNNPEAARVLQEVLEAKRVKLGLRTQNPQPTPSNETNVNADLGQEANVHPDEVTPSGARNETASLPQGGGAIQPQTPVGPTTKIRDYDQKGRLAKEIEVPHEQAIRDLSIRQKMLELVRDCLGGKL